MAKNNADNVIVNRFIWQIIGKVKNKNG